MTGHREDIRDWENWPGVMDVRIQQPVLCLHKTGGILEQRGSFLCDIHC